MSVEGALVSDAHADLIDMLPDAIVACDADRRTVLWNPAAERLYGFSRAEVLGRRLSELLATEFPMPLIEMFETLVDTGEWHGDLVQHAKDGRELNVESHWIARRDDAGGFAGVLAVDRDITARLEDHSERERHEATAERERLHGRLSRAQRLESIGQLAGGVAHDFNNVLAIIINYAALIVGELDEMEQNPHPECWVAMRQDLAEIQTAADRAARLTHQLLSFSRHDVGNPVAISLNDSVRGLEELLRRTIAEHITLVTSLAGDLRAVRVDPGQVDQILLNLAVNSRDAMPEGGTLTIDTANVEVDVEYAAPRPELEPGPHVRLRVSDTGIGMVPQVAERAFDPFFTTKPFGQGTGLGLATVYGIVTQAGGHAKFYSEPGVGTTFSALFPVAREPVSTVPEKPRATPTRTAAGVQTILLVEDEEALLEVTRRILVRAGYEVISAETGKAALAAASAHPGTIDLLLSDVVMPGMLGHQLAAALRERRTGLRVLYMSGFAGSVFDGAVEMEGAELIEKPFTAPALLERIAALARPG